MNPEMARLYHLRGLFLVLLAAAVACLYYLRTWNGRRP